MERGNFSAAAGFGAFKADRFGVFRYVKTAYKDGDEADEKHLLRFLRDDPIRVDHGSTQLRQRPHPFLPLWCRRDGRQHLVCWLDQCRIPANSLVTLVSTSSSWTMVLMMPTRPSFTSPRTV
jgi:hypothetical protein